MSVKSTIKRDYMKKTAFGSRENEAKQSQIPAFGRKSEARSSKSEVSGFRIGPALSESNGCGMTGRGVCYWGMGRRNRKNSNFF